MPAKKRPTRPARPARPSRPRPARAVPKPRRGVPDALTDAARGVRLHKALADAGVAARRQCEDLVRQGRVTVNGEPVTALPAWVDLASDRVEVDGQSVNLARRTSARPGKRQPFVYLMLHKPRRVVSTTRDPQGRRTVLDLITPPKGGRPIDHARLFPVGRLDAESTGLILLTNDGDLANQLTHPRYGVPKQYRVSVRGELSEDDVARLQEGLYLAHRTPHGPNVKKAAMAQVKRLSVERDRTRGDRTNLLVTLREGQNREVRRLLARLGHKVRRLHRQAIGPLTLSGLAIGQWRPLTPAEVGRLRRAVGPRD